MKPEISYNQGDLFAVTTEACWSYDFDGDRILINERWPIEELRIGDVVVFLEQKILSYTAAYGVTHPRSGSVIPMAKIIPPSGKIGWIMMHHLKRL
jgi:hypothetical protein